MSDADKKTLSTGRRRRRSKPDSGRDSDGEDAEKRRKLKNQVTVGALLAALAFGLILIFMGMAD